MFGQTGAPHFRGPTRVPKMFMTPKLPVIVIVKNKETSQKN